MTEKTERILLSIVLFVVIDILNIYVFGNLTNAILIGGDGIMNSYFAPVYSGIALLCTFSIIKWEKEH